MFLILAQDYSVASSGLPDLILYRESDISCKVVEVKGPKDRLSDKQRAWLDQLLNAGLDVEICRVGELYFNMHQKNFKNKCNKK